MSRVWGGLPTHTLSPALFSHLRFAAQCWSYARCPQPSPNLSSQRRKILFSTESIPDFNALPLQARLGLLFPFSACPLPVCLTSPCGAGFSLTWIFRRPRIRPQLALTAPTGPVWGFAGIRFPTHPPKLQTGPYTGFFLSRTRYSSLSPTGKGRLVPENALSQSSGFAHNGPTRLQQGG